MKCFFTLFNLFSNIKRFCESFLFCYNCYNEYAMKEKEKSKKSNYLLFVMGLGLFIMLVSFLCSTIIFQGLLVTQNKLAIALLVISILFFCASVGVLVSRFIFKRKELGHDIADINIFIPSIFFYAAFGFFPPLLESLSNEAEFEYLFKMVNISWTIVGITACLYVMIVGWLILAIKNKNEGFVTNFFISLLPVILNIVINSLSTLYLFLWGIKNTEWANAVVYMAFVYTCLSVIYYIIISVILGFKVFFCANNKTDQDVN